MHKVMRTVRRWDPDCHMWEFVEEYESDEPDTMEEREQMVNLTKIVYGKEVWAKENGEWRRE